MKNLFLFLTGISISLPSLNGCQTKEETGIQFVQTTAAVLLSYAALDGTSPVFKQEEKPKEEVTPENVEPAKKEEKKFNAGYYWRKDSKGRWEIEIEKDKWILWDDVPKIEENSRRTFRR